MVLRLVLSGTPAAVGVIQAGGCGGTPTGVDGTPAGFGGTLAAVGVIQAGGCGGTPTGIVAGGVPTGCDTSACGGTPARGGTPSSVGGALATVGGGVTVAGGDGVAFCCCTGGAPASACA
ncbi:Hypothetical predicted protein [Octopus vulgaris]|uniref:Uncharacterized protein n=1 Tax=Octopus vulgaris TaxID=6645 RepID=A0AA36BJR6_OCTVU|nr:Hypothetical predicted protein [Octopus vulgaris]